MEKHYREILLALGVMVGGGLMWALPWWVWGEREPWDVAFPLFYFGPIALLGGLYGALSRLPFLAVMILGWTLLVIGQLAVSEMIPGIDRSWRVLGMVMIAGSSCLIFLGIAIGAALSADWRESKKPEAAR